MNGQTQRFAIRRGRTTLYFYFSIFLWMTLVLPLGLLALWLRAEAPSKVPGDHPIAVFPWVWLAIMGAYALLVGPWLAPWRVRALKYRLAEKTLCIDSGVIFLRRKRIPLDRITDVTLSQGPLARCCGIWVLAVQTAGTGKSRAEANLYGLDDPEQARDLIIAARDAAVANPGQDV